MMRAEYKCGQGGCVASTSCPHCLRVVRFSVASIVVNQADIDRGLTVHYSESSECGMKEVHAQ